MRIWGWAAAVALLGVAFAGCSSQPDIVTMQAWVRAPAPTQTMTAGYVMIHNNGSETDALLSAACDAVETVELHEMVMAPGEVMRMRPVDRIEIPAGGHVTLEPGGVHMMLIGFRRQLTEGDRVSMVLNFEKAGSVTLEAPVQIQLGAPAHKGHDH